MLQADVGADHALELGERLACTEPALERCRVAGRGGQPTADAQAKHLRQLLGYAAWAEDHLKVEAQRIRCLAVYLQNGYEEVEKQPTRADLQGLAAEVAAEVQQMQDLLRDPERNIPLEKVSFPLTENLGYCCHCQFRELCDRV